MAKQKPQLDKVRVGVIGAGIGQAHLNGYAKVAAAEVVAVCDLNEERARQAVQSSGLENVDILTEYRVLLGRSDIDAVSVCLPNTLHRPIAIDCLNAGKHVICEKPLSISAAEGQKIANAAAKNKKKCMVAQVNRFRSDSRLLKQMIVAGELGNIYYAHTGMLRKRGIPGFGGWFTTKAMSGGGPLIDIGVHLLDIAWWLCGCPKPVTASGSTYAAFGPRGKGQGGSRPDTSHTGTFDVEDLAVALLRFDNGLTINLEVSWALNIERERQWCQIFGVDGGCDWGEHPGVYREERGLTSNTKFDLPKGDPWQGQMQHFVDCILNDTTPDPDVEQGVAMMRMLDAIYKSAQTKREVVIR